MLFRVAYLSVNNTLVLLRLLPMSDRKQGCRDLGAAPSVHGPRTATARRESLLHPSRPGLARRSAAPAPPRRPAQPAVGGAAGDRAALAPQPDRSPALQDVPNQEDRAAKNHPVDPPAGAGPGRRERHLGVPKNPRRTARPRHCGCHFDRVGDPPRGRYRPSAPTTHGRHSCARKPTPCSPPISSTP